MSLRQEPEFKIWVPKNWVEFFKKVIHTAEFSGQSLDEVAALMYTEAVRAELGHMPTPPWHRKKTDG